MPKKFAGENSKAVAARARKTEAKNAQEALKKKQEEDEAWKDDNKHVLKKQHRHDEQERKRQETLEKKKEAKALLEREMDSIKTQGKQPLAKITRAQIVAETEKRNQMARQAATKQDATPTIQSNKPLEENINRYNAIGEVASTVDDAISLLRLKDDDPDRHPEKRMRAAYSAFETANLPRLKEENPTLRHTQLKQLLFKDWQKSPDNPMNQKNTK